MVGNLKIFCLKFADGVVAIVDTKEGLDGTLKNLEKYCDRNKMEVNAEKIKIMIFRKGEKGKGAKNVYPTGRL